MDEKQISNIKQRGFTKEFWLENITKVCQLKPINECFEQLYVLNVDKSGSVVDVEPQDIKDTIDEFMELRGLMKKALAKCKVGHGESKKAINEYIKQIDMEHKNLLKKAAKVTGIEAKAAKKDELLKIKKINAVYEKIEKPLVDRTKQCNDIRLKILEDHNNFANAGEQTQESGKKRWEELHKYMQLMPVGTLKKMFETEFPTTLQACVKALADVDQENADIKVERKKLETRLVSSAAVLKEGKKNFQDLIDTFAGIKGELQRLANA